MIEAKVIEDSVAPHGKRLTTLQLRYPRFIHAEAKTHRILSISGEEYALTHDEGFMSDRNLSRNASSSRAVPVAKTIEQVINDPATPVHWGKNQAGMQAREELTGDSLERAKVLWKSAATCAAGIAEDMLKLGLHKQVANRILEPFQWISVVVTASEWGNFFELRNHPDAQPEIKALAEAMAVALAQSSPFERGYDMNSIRNWHLPYISFRERGEIGNPWSAAEISSARCARVSYLTHDGQTPSLHKDKSLFEALVGSKPLHASPTEHQGYPIQAHEWCKNFGGWFQFRQAVEQEFV
ncbi:FAD-dependent thymidylate synthase [Burkholderia gladioli]|uniref:FAD-dependent thymidylate synthase n=1 Tax=Burkholderia gladioli TaxID=28095 RepID=UPI003B509E4C